MACGWMVLIHPETPVHFESLGFSNDYVVSTVGLVITDLCALI